MYATAIELNWQQIDYNTDIELEARLGSISKHVVEK